MLPFEVTARGVDGAAGQADVAGMLVGTPGVRLVVDISLLDPAAGGTYLCFADGAGLDRLVSAQRGWQAWAKSRGLDLKWSGVASQLQAMSSGVTRVAATAVPGMVLLASLVVWLVGGCDWRLGLIGAWVNFFPVAALVVLLVLLGLPISLPSLMIGAIAVGAAVDDTLHIVQGLRRGGDVRRVLIGCWRPCVGSSLITAACMSVFVLSPFGPTHQFGVLMAATVIAALVGDMLLLPAAIVLMKRRPDRACRGLSAAAACTGSV